MSRRLPSALFALLCIGLVAWFLAKATFSLRDQSVEAPGAPAPAAGGTASAPDSPGDFEVINARNLLGISVSPPESRRDRKGNADGSGGNAGRLSAAGVDALPVSKKGWKLLGTIVDAGAGKESRAIIQSEGKEQPFRVGDTLQGWTIALVQRRTVVLVRDGTRERLIMGDAPGPQAAAAKPDEEKTVSRNRLRDELGDIGALMRNVAVSPQTLGGYQGLRIIGIQPGSYLEELGLRKDDLLLGANDRPLTGFGDLAGLGDLADAGAITLEVLRNGKKTIIRYDVQS